MAHLAILLHLKAINKEIFLGEDLVEAKEEEVSLWMEENISGVCNVLTVNIGVVKKKVCKCQMLTRGGDERPRISSVTAGLVGFYGEGT